ncbi:MAG TPA: phosphomannomutase/phosphoglucomutase, partial [Candidatus Saccharimonadales bacterium]|nr:phosphomannomutase/phosphoglucomutase [Candidatus Saccharimonadales bacterium]
MADYEKIFKAYDVRGICPSEIDEAAIYRIGEAYMAVNRLKNIVVGRDVRKSGAKLKQQLIKALIDNGANVTDIGIITTDQLYFAVGQYGFDGGISVTASHNPGEYNGLKFSEAGGAPIASDQLMAIRDWAASDNKLPAGQTGKLNKKSILDDYVAHVLSYVDASKIKPLKIVANANFGAVGRVVDILAKKLNLELERLNWEQDGRFPKGPPNPLLPENRDETIALIKKTKPDFGVAWDADADRVFLFAGDGTFIPSPYLIALLAPEFLKKYPESKIIHDVTTAWVIDDSVRASGGIPVINRTGHTFMKARMRQEDAPFAGESSGHYYFRDSFYADNGIVPFLMALQLVSESGRTLKQLIEPLMASYKVSGEINFSVDSPAEAVARVEKHYQGAGKFDKTDGLVVETKAWRFSVRPSNTEPLFRLNAEARDQSQLDKLVAEISS